PCGSGLARDEAIKFNIDVGSYTAIASKLAPTLISADTEIVRAPTSPVGASLLAMRPVGAMKASV
ncbi:MAG: hypothetical protein ACRES5_27705, partial [Pseudomonas sp.]